MKKLLFGLVVSGLFCLPGMPGIPKLYAAEESDDFLEEAETKREKELILAMRKLAARKIEAAVPVLHELFRRTKRSSKPPYFISPVRGEIILAITAIGGDAARRSLKEIVATCLKEGSNSNERRYPFHDEEYCFITGSLEDLVKLTDKSLETWFLKIAENPAYDYGIREDAYTGYLKAKLDRLKPRAVKEAVMLILPDLNSPGNGEWDYFHSPIKETDPFGKKDWAIKDTARCRVLIEQGPPALPLLWKKYRRFAARKKLSKAEKRKQYGIAEVIKWIYANHKLPNPPRLETCPKNWKEVWLKNLKEHQKKVDRYRQSQQKK